jgi:hypothetical protein
LLKSWRGLKDGEEEVKKMDEGAKKKLVRLVDERGTQAADTTNYDDYVLDMMFGKLIIIKRDRGHVERSIGGAHTNERTRR